MTSLDIIAYIFRHNLEKEFTMFRNGCMDKSLNSALVQFYAWFCDGINPEYLA